MAYSGRGRGPYYDHQPAGTQGQSSTNNRGQSSGAGSSRREALPSELPTAINQSLSPDEPLLSGEYNDRDLLRELSSLCLVSKRIDSISLSSLLKKVPIKSLHVLVALFRALAKNRDLAAYINEIVFGVDFRQGLGPLQLSEHERKDLVEELHRYASGELLDPRNDFEIMGLLFYEILARASNLGSLTIFMVGDSTRTTIFDQRYHDRLRMQLGQPIRYIPFFNKVWRATETGARGVGPAFLPNLKTLTFFGSRETLVEPEMFAGLLDIPSLTSVKSINDNGNWCHIAPYPGLYKVREQSRRRCPRQNITNLVLSGSAACLHDLDDIAQSFPCLKSLSVSFLNSQPGRFESYMSQDTGRTLSTALAKITSLQALEINIYPGFDMTFAVTTNRYRDLMASLGPQHTLDLGRLAYLEKLEVPLYMFANVGLEDLGLTPAVPCHALPRSLKTLVLLARCRGGHSEESPCWASVSSAIDFLESFRDNLRHFPRLKTVSYYYGRDSCGDPFLPIPGEYCSEENKKVWIMTRSRLAELRHAFWDHQVDLLFDWDGPERREPERM